MAQLRDHDAREDGFTLPEVTIVIVLMGIVFAIASSTWFGVVQSRAVDAAANQVASDLRLAHTRATNQLVDWGMTTDPTSYPGLTLPVGIPPGDYYLLRIPSSGVLALSDITARNLPEEGAETEIDPSTPLALRFHPNGSVETVGTGVTTVQVHLAGEPYNSNPRHNIEVNVATSRVKIDP